MKIVAYSVRLHVVFNPTYCPLHTQSFFRGFRVIRGL